LERCHDVDCGFPHFHGGSFVQLFHHIGYAAQQQGEKEIAPRLINPESERQAPSPPLNIQPVPCIPAKSKNPANRSTVELLPGLPS
jgi:hypothetical protein